MRLLRRYYKRGTSRAIFRLSDWPQQWGSLFRRSSIRPLG